MAATVHVALVRVSNLANGIDTLPVPDEVPVSTDYLSSVATSAQADITSPAASKFPGSLYWIVTPAGGNVWVKFGSDPTASAGNDWLLIAGTARMFKAGPAEKCAAIDAA